MYSGAGDLENLESAVNYNHYLLTLIIGRLRGAEKVLDFGAGTGHMAMKVREFVSDIVAVEPDKNLSELIRSRGIRLELLDSIAPNSLDLIYSLNVFEHIEEDCILFANLVSKLRKGGRILIYVPAVPLLFSKFDARIGHLRRYTKRSLSQLLGDTVLQEVEIRSHDPLGAFVALAYKFLINSGSIDATALQFYDRRIFPISVWMENHFPFPFGKNMSLTGVKP
jgi:SAM-dependent methyltransferase